MKPCSRNRKLIAWLALDALEAEQARNLRAHLETCEACRCYLEEVSAVRARLAAAEPRMDIQASEAFHQKVLRRLRAEESEPVWEAVLALIAISFTKSAS